jgi:hypothetical protein
MTLVTARPTGLATAAVNCHPAAAECQQAALHGSGAAKLLGRCYAGRQAAAQWHVEDGAKKGKKKRRPGLALADQAPPGAGHQAAVAAIHPLSCSERMQGIQGLVVVIA